ncbi:hypothetical protein [Limnofasciculus baicalensis]|uniref:Uncharacterized protein n=1 Tax=Limnofasciculus baicalensis BBK-W-15 TaxID=2699891 RepID=A0AAE3KMR7_9CYAN|nr:hypothetical protein [Limnofasciculus baicalensis]MCP2729765.1 hypothetical protein [Limnofasciculus baicalensis BBK-W-15]
MNEGSMGNHLPEKMTRHFATDKEQCKKMGRLNGWTLISAKPAQYPDPILKVECIFEGEQTSFMEDD